MSPKEWKYIKERMIDEGFEVKTYGKNKREYICEKGDVLVNFERGDSSCIVTVYDVKNDNIELSENYRYITEKVFDAILDTVHFINVYMRGE